jgi:hypothetical protein
MRWTQSDGVESILDIFECFQGDDSNFRSIGPTKEGRCHL